MPAPAASTHTAPSPAMTHAFEDTITTITQGMETTIKVGFDLQQALIDSSFSVLNATVAASKTATEQWLAFSKQQQPSLLGALEKSLQSFEQFVPTPR